MDRELHYTINNFFTEPNWPNNGGKGARGRNGEVRADTVEGEWNGNCSGASKTERRDGHFLEHPTQFAANF